MITVATDGVDSLIPLPTGSNPTSVAFSPDGTAAYVANSSTDTVSVIAVATGALGIPIGLPPGSQPRYVAFSPNGTKAYVANFGSDTISVVNTGLPPYTPPALDSGGAKLPATGVNVALPFAVAGFLLLASAAMVVLRRRVKGV